MNTIAELKQYTQQLIATPNIFNAVNSEYITDVNHLTSLHFKHANDVIVLIGKPSDSYIEVDTQATNYFINHAIEQHLIQSIYAINKGGLMIALMKCCADYDLGFNVMEGIETVTLQGFWLDETAGKYVISVKLDNLFDVLQQAKKYGITAITMGDVTNGNMIIGEDEFGNIADWKVLMT